jgi:hypothetical protein
VTLERTRYLVGQVLGQDDLAQDQLYFREKARRHNRTLHGWGVVCGLHVDQGSSRAEVLVTPGYALDPYGEEIVIEREVTVDLCKEDRDGNAVVPCEAADDRSGAAVRIERSPGQPLYVAVEYAECHERPVPVVTSDAEETTEFSRVRESFAIKVLTQLPATYSKPRAPARRRRFARAKAEHQRNHRSCPESPGEPCVILADVVLDSNLEVASIDPLTHRRYVASFAE